MALVRLACIVYGLLSLMGDGVLSMTALQLQSATDAAVADDESSLSVPAGDYYFNSSVYLVQGAQNLIIQGQVDRQGIPTTTLWFALGGDVTLLNCINVTVRNIAIDFNGTYAQGSISSISDDGWSFTAGFSSALLLPDPNLSPFFAPPYDVNIKICLYYPNNRSMIRHAELPTAINVFMRTSTSMGPTSPFDVLYNITVNRNLRDYLGRFLPSSHEPQPLVTIMPRGYRHSLLLTNASNSLLDNVHLYGGSSMGVVDSGGYGNNTYRYLNMTRRPYTHPVLGVTVDRLLAINADGFHSTSNTVGPRIVDSHLSWTGDDLMNICSAMMVVLDAWPIGSSSSRGQQLHVAVLDNGHYVRKVQPGDTHSFYHLNTERYQASAVIDNVHASTNQSIIAQAATAFQVLTNPPYNASFTRAALASGTGVYEMDITVTAGEPDAVAAYWSLVHYDRFQNRNAILRNTAMHNGYSRVLLIKGSGMVVEDNSFADAGGIHIGPEQEWLEGDPGITNITVTNNVLTRCGHPGIQEQPCLAANKAKIDLRNNTEIEQTGV
eukprot:TRINITY_DN4765_c0_g2_i1.p1 TRINITY_DN4765_c0_g2~~TRINITY_DN4765_c0_g2_i1.p1  ORF type:complete len:550 (+),score=133.67 TRINITY_DN4765_c0_g2_i1:1640-3289(+)